MDFDCAGFIDSERSASSSEVDASARLDATGAIQPANSDGSRPGVREQPPPVVNAGAINNLPDNEWAADRPARKVNPPIKGPEQTSNQRVVDDTVRKEGEDYLGEPWATLLWRYPAEFAAAVAAYQGEMEFEVQAKEIANGNRATFTRQTTRYGPGQRPFVEAIFNRDSKLRVLRGGHRAALDSGEAATARSIGIQIGELLDGWVSA